MASFNKYNGFVEALAEKSHNLGSDALKIVLSNTAPDATDTNLASMAEITAGNGYTSGGNAVTTSSSSQTSGTYKLVLADVTITASGGSIGPFRYAILINSTADLGIGWWDYGSSTTLADGESITVDFDAGTGVLQLA
jgi:hypothetical protein